VQGYWSFSGSEASIGAILKMHLNEYQKGILLTAFGVICIVPDALFVRIIDADPLVIAFWRSLLAGLIIAAFINFQDRGASYNLIKKMGAKGWIYCAILASTSPAFVLAVSNTSVANVVFIFASMPIFTAIFSWMLLGEKISARTTITMLLVTVGLSIIAYGSTDNENAHWSGDGFALYISIAYGFAFTILRGMRATSMVPVVPVAFCGSALLLALIANPFSGFFENFWLYALHGIFIAVGTTFLTLGPRRLPAPEVSLLILLESILAPLLVWAVLGEDPGQFAILGGTIVIGALAISNLIAFLKW
jgi:drug/metabolite transporter (DMT)-like permease